MTDEQEVASTNTTDARGILNSFIVRLAAARVALLAILHALIFSFCYPLAWLVRFDFKLPAAYVNVVTASLLWVVGIELAIGVLFGFYRGWWRYVGIHDVLRLAAGCTTMLAALLALWYTERWTHFSGLLGVSRAVVLINYAFSLLAIFGTRVLVRLMKDIFRFESTVEVSRVLIIGAGDAGEALAREIQHRPSIGLHAVAFVDDQRAKWRSHIRGIPVLGPISNIASIAADKNATEALIAIPTASGKRIREIIRMLADANIRFRTVPGLDQLVTGRVQATQLRPVNADDLVRRKEIVLPGDRVGHLFRNKRIVVTGAGGSIGSELTLQILSMAPEQLHAIERSELALYDLGHRIERETRSKSETVRFHLSDFASAAAMLGDIRPHVVVHAAAHKHVPLGEQNPAEYVRNNCVAARAFAEACEAAGVERFVFVSTDKAIEPASVMGASKRAAEIALLDLARRTKMKISIVRFGNIIGSSGSVVPLFAEQIAAGGPVTVTHPDTTRYFLRTTEAISLILQAAVIGEGIHMLDMGEPIRIADLARDLIMLSNRSPEDIAITYTGLRPGEKLHEIVRSETEKHVPTEHPRIVGVHAPLPAADVVQSWYRRLEHAAMTQSPALAEVLREVMPELRQPPPTRAIRPETETFPVRGITSAAFSHPSS
ncbi:MAG TPA: nucleoside-diphosphate sugar epimerase/dehydratase [Thermoanaerobaculia bacterium]|nr:nucleoside-diphosphate sugar epimerase/dehydratase [Thermoanaerobaculia bacterium]